MQSLPLHLRFRQAAVIRFPCLDRNRPGVDDLIQQLGHTAGVRSGIYRLPRADQSRRSLRRRFCRGGSNRG